MPAAESPSAAVLAVLAPWLAQLGPVTCAELIVTLPDGQTRSLRASIATAPAPRPATVPVAVPAPVPAPLPVPPAAPRTRPTQPTQALTDKERRLLTTASGEPLPRKTLIVRAKLRYNSHSRAVVNSLIKRGLLLIDGAGVRAAPTAAPAP